MTRVVTYYVQPSSSVMITRGHCLKKNGLKTMYLDKINNKSFKIQKQRLKTYDQVHFVPTSFKVERLKLIYIHNGRNTNNNNK